MVSDKPSQLDDCDGITGIDSTPQVIRFVEFILLADERAKDRKPAVHIVQPQTLRGDAANIEYAADFQRLVSDTLPRVVSGASSSPLRASRHEVEGALSAFAGEPVATGAAEAARDVDVADLTDDELRAKYGVSLAAKLVAELHALRPDSDNTDVQSRLRFETDRASVDLVADTFFPAKYVPLPTPHPVVALCAIYEQVWEPTGYTRGELVGSFSLAPGENLTVEVHTWDKSSRKTENELATEAELRTSESFTQRDALTVAQETARQRSTHVNATATVPFPKMPISLSQDISTDIRTSLRRSRESVTESTRSASRTLKVTRKAKVEIARETGREERQLRVITNQNECHTLNFHYFELVANYKLSTRLKSVVPAALVDSPNSVIDADWIMCHEGLLTESLLDKTFLAGFEAAKTLRIMELVKAEQAELSASASNPFSLAASPLVSGIVTSYQNLRTEAAKITAKPAMSDLASWNAIVQDTILLSQFLYFNSIRPVAAAALEAIELSTQSSQDPGAALLALIRQISGQPLVVQSDQSLETRLRSLGFRESNVDSLSTEDRWPLDDMGLQAAVSASGDAIALLAEQESSDDTSRQRIEVTAEARMDLERLICHMNDNRLHYLQTVWRAEAADQRMARLSGYGNLITAIENELLGFSGEKAALPIREAWWSAVPEIVEAVEAAQEVLDDSIEVETIAVPTQGTILEGVLGICDSCEPHRDVLRAIELRSFEASARQAEAEADRREALLAASPPDLSPFDPTMP